MLHSSRFRRSYPEKNLQFSEPTLQERLSIRIAFSSRPNRPDERNQPTDTQRARANRIQHENNPPIVMLPVKRNNRRSHKQNECKNEQAKRKNRKKRIQGHGKEEDKKIRSRAQPFCRHVQFLFPRFSYLFPKFYERSPKYHEHKKPHPDR